MKKIQNKICNLSYLKELSHGNTEFVKEMIQIFLAEMPEEISSLEKGIQQKNFTLIKQTAHKLKSTIPFVGLNLIIEKEVSEIEELADKQTDLKRIESLFMVVKEMCQKAADELSESFIPLPTVISLN